jgi:predicted dehydrogenase
MVNFNYRFSEPSWLIHQAVTSGIVGDIYYAKTGWLRNRGIPGIGGWFTTKRLSGGGALIDLGVHRLDLALWYMGYPQPISATGTIHGQFGKILADSQGKTFDVDDLAVGFVRFANGASLVIEASWAGNSEKREEMFTQIFGTRGGAIQRNVGEGYEFEARIFQDVAGTLTEVKPLSGLQGLEPIRHHFIHCLQKGIEPIAPGEHGLVLMQILDAIYASAASGHAEPITPLL